MKRVTTDTNILISATFWHGTSAKIIQRVENKEIILVLSPSILEEYREVLASDEIQAKIKNKNLEMALSFQKICGLAEIINPISIVAVVDDDPDDNKILECAIDGKVDYIITNDKHLLVFKEHQSIKIMTPEEFLTKLD